MFGTSLSGKWFWLLGLLVVSNIGYYLYNNWGLVTVKVTDAPLSKVINSIEWQGWVKIYSNLPPSTTFRWPMRWKRLPPMLIFRRKPMMAPTRTSTVRSVQRVSLVTRRAHRPIAPARRAALPAPRRDRMVVAAQAALPVVEAVAAADLAGVRSGISRSSLRRLLPT
jgi:hypothetical protein